MAKAPLSGKLPQQLDEQALFYDIRIRNQKILKNTQTAPKSNPFDF